MDKTQPILSICIPTYNRCNHIIPVVKKILSSSNHKFEIIVSDNASNDGTADQLKQIRDNRLILIEQPTNVGSFQNGFEVMKAAKGKYLLVLLDRDSIDITYLDKIIDKLEAEDIAVGCFAANCHTKKNNFKKSSSLVKNIGTYSLNSNHPSIFFYNS